MSSERRYLPANTYAALKAASKRLTDLNGGGAGSARITRLGQQDFSRRVSHASEHADRYLPLDVIADLEAAAGVPEVTATLAELADCVLVKLPPALAAGSPLGRITGEAMREVSEVFSALGAALEDGQVTPAEQARIGAEIDEAIAKLLTLQLQVRAEAEGGR